MMKFKPTEALCLNYYSAINICHRFHGGQGGGGKKKKNQQNAKLLLIA